MYAVDNVQACEPDELERWEGVTVTVAPEPDDMGHPRVSIASEDFTQLVEYLLTEWHGADPDWFARIIADIREV